MKVPAAPRMSADGRQIELPGWTRWQADVLLAGHFKRDHAELLRLRQWHRDDAHGGADGDGATCVDCGFVTAAIYDVTTGGRRLTEDFLSVRPQPAKQQEPS